MERKPQAPLTLSADMNSWSLSQEAGGCHRPASSSSRLVPSLLACFWEVSVVAGVDRSTGDCSNSASTKGGGQFQHGRLWPAVGHLCILFWPIVEGLGLLAVVDVELPQTACFCTNPRRSFGGVEVSHVRQLHVLNDA